MEKEVDCGRLGKSGGYYGWQAWNICHSYLNAAMNSYYQREKRPQKEEIRSQGGFLSLSLPLGKGVEIKVWNKRHHEMFCHFVEILWKYLKVSCDTIWMQCRWVGHACQHIQRPPLTYRPAPVTAHPKSESISLSKSTKIKYLGHHIWWNMTMMMMVMMMMMTQVSHVISTAKWPLWCNFLHHLSVPKVNLKPLQLH